MKMKTITKLWLTGAAAGAGALAALCVTIGYALGADTESVAFVEVSMAMMILFGFTAVASCLSAVIVRVLQGDRVAAANLAEVGQRLGTGHPPGTLRLVDGSRRATSGE